MASERNVTLLLASPALDAPPGADTRMTAYSRDQVWFWLAFGLCIAIPGLFLLVRLYTKLVIVRKLDEADSFILLGYPFIIAEAIVGRFMVKYGAGQHQWQVTLAQLYEQLHYMNIAEIVYCPAIFAVKMAILVQYLRMFAPNRTVNRTMFFGAWFMIAACFIFYTIVMFWTIFYCTPRPMIWNKLTPGGHCHDHGPIVISSGIFNMVSDVVILLLPTSSLWRLRVPLGRKIAISLLFATGLLACGASVMRIVFTIKIAPKISEADVSFHGLWIGLWSEAEITLGFICACALSLPKLMQAKRKQISEAFSFISIPWSTIKTYVGSEKSTSTDSTGRTGTRSTIPRSRRRQGKEEDEVFVLQSFHFESLEESIAKERDADH
ncbi:hypothetical protein K469DRAFT_631985, partial [Zopfia rhizophila CBS 207.26]